MTQEYILKHKNIPVLIFYLDDTTYKLVDMGDILDYDRLPYGLADKENRIQNGIQLNSWILGRGLPDSRKDKQSVKLLFNVDELNILAIQAKGLNVTDQYWFHKTNLDIKWENVNYFNNTFDNVMPGSNVIPGIDKTVNRESPNVCVDGSIEKRWIIRDNERFLIKGSRYRLMQEPFNEVIASKILDLFNIDHVHYDLKYTDKGIPYSECKCMCDQGIEFINAQWIINQKPNEENDLFSHFLKMCKDNGIQDAKERIDEMLALDFLIGNEDRHRGNFGILRNAETLQWLGINPIFDNGNSLFFDRDNDELESFGIDSLGKAFGDSNRLNLQLLNYPEWYDSHKGKNIVDIVAGVLNDNKYLLSDRIDKIIEVIKERIKVFENDRKLHSKT
jgi:hypothetical protein